ncbi:MAG: M23 family metallopeptidase, partial [Clostridiales Family XIII bacterium]|nr:M23 family metallopeptidase [Clostridiales Family XIII bacterium]
PVALVVVIVVALLVAGFFLVRQYLAGEYDAYDPSTAILSAAPVEVAGQNVLPQSADVRVPVFGGRLYKEASYVFWGSYDEDEEDEDGWSWQIVSSDCAEGEGSFAGLLYRILFPAVTSIISNALPPEPTDLGELGETPYTVAVDAGPEAPAGVEVATRLTLKKKDGVVFEKRSVEDVTAEGLLALAEAGDYRLTLETEWSQGGVTGTTVYACDFSLVYPPMAFTAGRTDLQQGDIFAMRLENLSDGLTPVSETKLGFSVWTLEEDPEAAPGTRTWTCAVPVGNHVSPGTYAVSVAIEGTDDEAILGAVPASVDVTVSEYSFDHQNLIIDTSTPSVAASLSPESGVEYAKKIPPLMQQYDETQYWQGLFQRPVEGGWISTNFGEIRITNGDASTVRSHYGMDFAVAEGVPVHAGNAGRVVLAEMLLRTGGTVVIEHGGGLKSYYFHMSRVDATEGEMVALGDQIGLVGSTGYSTGPHLHYEMRIGDQAIDPARLFEKNAGLFSAEP